MYLVSGPLVIFFLPTSFRDISNLEDQSTTPPRLLGSLSSHTRPLAYLAYNEVLDEIYTADSMGVINAWKLDFGPNRTNCRGVLVTHLEGHRTGVNNLVVHEDLLWTGE